MNRIVNVKSVIQAELLRCRSCMLEMLLDRLPQYSWNQIFIAVDQMSRNGDLVLSHPTRFDYEVSLGPVASATEQVHLGRDADGVTYPHAGRGYYVKGERARRRSVASEA